MAGQRLHEIRPGAALEGDWYHGTIPTNVVVGEGCLVDSTHCFKQFFSRRDPAMVLGEHVTILRTSLALEGDAELSIGSFTYIASASIAVAERVTIGSYCMVAGGVTIVDSDFHPLDPAQRVRDTVALSPVGARRRRPEIGAAPVAIGDDVWIGPSSSILKGVTIGDGAVVGAGSVVLHDVPAGASVAGNPATVVGAPT